MKEKIKNIFNEFIKSDHHAFLLKSEERENSFDYFKKEIQEKYNNKNQSIFLNLKIFDIDKAREIISLGKLKFEEKVYFVFSFYSMTRETQNSLLKFLEDTPENIKIIFIINPNTFLLNTIKSRTYELESINNIYGFEDLKNIADKFLKTNKLERFKMKELQDILNKKDEYAEEFEDKERIDREGIENFLVVLHKKIFDKLKNKKNIEDLNNIEKINGFLKYIKNNSSSGKTILEYLSLKL